jgi:hypothetical protein
MSPVQGRSPMPKCFWLGFGIWAIQSDDGFGTILMAALWDSWELSVDTEHSCTGNASKCLCFRDALVCFGAAFYRMARHIACSLIHTCTVILTGSERDSWTYTCLWHHGDIHVVRRTARYIMRWSRCYIGHARKALLLTSVMCWRRTFQPNVTYSNLIKFCCGIANTTIFFSNMQESCISLH